MEQRVQIARRWALSVWFPNLSLNARVKANSDLESVASERPDWFRSFASGLLSNLASTLPDQDRWRAASARLGGVTAGGAPPDTDGATLGTSDDFDDLASDHPRPEWMHDVVAAPALDEDLSTESAALVVIAMTDPSSLHAALSVIAGQDSDATVSSAFEGAARWLGHRRVMYGVATADLFPVHASMLWAVRAAMEVDDGQAWDDDDFEAELDDMRLDRNSVEETLRRQLEPED